MRRLFLQLLLFPVVVLSSSSQKEPFLLPQESTDYFLTEEPAEPKFLETKSNVTAQLGGTAFLHCSVVNPFGDRAVSYPTISWVRRRDWHILSNGVRTFTTDDRFTLLHKEGSYDWILQIKYVQERDAGVYECQVSTNNGSISRQVTVNVVSPIAYILGGDEYHIDKASQISLVCVIENAPTPPQYVFWYHNDRMVNYDSDRGIRVSTESGPDKTKSSFKIASASPNDSGNYTCKPSNAMPASIQVFVSKGRVDKMEALHKQTSLLINNPSGSTDATSSSSSQNHRQSLSLFLSSFVAVSIGVVKRLMPERHSAA